MSDETPQLEGTGWQATWKEDLRGSWAGYWVKVYVDPPIGAYIDLQEAVAAVEQTPNEATFGAVVALLPQLVAETNLTTRDGLPMVWEVRVISALLLLEIVAAVRRVQNEAGASADPLLTRKRRVPSPERASQAKRSRRATRSGG